MKELKNWLSWHIRALCETIDEGLSLKKTSGSL